MYIYKEVLIIMRTAISKRMFVLLLTSLCLFLMLITAVHADAPKVLSSHSYAGETLSHMQFIDWMWDEFEKRTEGRYEVERYYNEALAKAADQMEACGNGLIDAFFNSMGYNPNELLLNRVSENICITENYWVQIKAAMELYNTDPLIKSEWENQNLVLLTLIPNDIMTIMSKIAIHKIEDFEGIKLRGYAASGKAVQLLGADVINIAAPERYDALAKGVVDGMSGIALDTGYAEKLFELAPFVSNPGFGMYGTTYLAMNKDVYESLSDNDRAILDELSSELVDYAVTRHTDIFKEAIIDMVENYDCKIYDFAPEEKEKIVELTADVVWKDWVDLVEKAGKPGQETLDKYIALVKKYESEAKEKDKGVYWPDIYKELYE